MKAAGLLIAVVMMLACSTAPEPAPFTEAKSPPARGYHNLIDTGKGLLLFGGETGPRGHLLGDLWTYHRSGGWKQHTGLGAKGGGAVFAASAGKLVVFINEQGNFQPANETWVYDPAGDSWKQLATPANQPDADELVDGAIAYDPAADRVVFLSATAETWTYNLTANAWHNMQPATHPVAPAGASMAYDPRADRMVLFGGGLGNVGVADTWAYDYNRDSWAKLNPAVSPPPRMLASMVYDPPTQRLVLFGGETTHPGKGVLADMWSYDALTNTWIEVSPTTRPAARAWHSMAYDTEGKGIVLFGGSADPFAFKNDTWIYESGRNTWSSV